MLWGSHITHLIWLHHISDNLIVVKTYDLTSLKTFYFVWVFWGFWSNKRQYSHKHLFCSDTLTQITNITNMWLLMKQNRLFNILDSCRLLTLVGQTAVCFVSLSSCWFSHALYECWIWLWLWTLINGSI